VEEESKNIRRLGVAGRQLPSSGFEISEVVRGRTLHHQPSLNTCQVLAL
jgi:hypothetical protein